MPAKRKGAGALAQERRVSRGGVAWTTSGSPSPVVPGGRRPELHPLTPESMVDETPAWAKALTEKVESISTRVAAFEAQGRASSARGAQLSGGGTGGVDMRAVEEVRRELGGLKARPGRKALAKTQPRRAGSSSDDSGAGSASDEDSGEEVSMKAFMREFMRAARKKPSSAAEPDSGTMGTRGFVSQQKELQRYRKDPMRKYRHVMRAMREEVREEGLEEAVRDEEREDPQTAKEYFRKMVPMGKYKLAQSVLRLNLRMHAALREGKEETALGLVAATYQMLEQYSLDEADLSLAWALTQEKALGAEFPSESPAVEGIGALAEPGVIAAEIGRSKDVSAWKAAREALKKTGAERRQPGK